MGTSTETNMTETKEKVLLILDNLLKEGHLTREEVSAILPSPKGRQVNDLPDFTFPSTGIVVKVRKLGPFTLDAIQRQMRAEIERPKPPVTVVNYGDADNPDFRSETNEADKSYQQALAEYEQQIEERGALRMIDVIIDGAVVADIDKEEVAAMRRLLRMLRVPQSEIDEMSDQSVFVKHICIKSTDDLQALQAFVVGQSIPSEALVQAHEDSFRSDVPRETDQAVQDSNVGDQA